MAQFNDLFFAALRNAGYTGALPDMRYQWMQDNGYANMREAAADLGFTTGHISDFLYAAFGSGLFSPGDVFDPADVGAFFNVQRLAAMYQTAAAVTPAIAGNDVGAFLDDSQGIAAVVGTGSQLITDGGIDDPSKWATSNGATDSGGVLGFSGTNQLVSQDFGAALGEPQVAGDIYVLQFDVLSYSAGNLNARIGNASPYVNVASANQTSRTVLLEAADAVRILRFQSAAGGTFQVDNVSLHRFINNTAFQTTDTARPTLTFDAVNDAYYLADDGDDALTVAMPNLGTDATRVIFNRDGTVTYLENQTIGAGDIDIPLGNKGVLYIDRDLTAGEKADLEAWNA